VVVALVVACLAQDCRSDLGGLIERLGSDSVQVRDDASAILAYVGEAALPDLDRALDSPDAEVAARAGVLIARIAPHRGAAVREMAHLFTHACRSFEAGRLDASVFYCDGVLRIDPAYPPARRLREAALRASEEEGGRESFLAAVEAWRSETSEADGSLPERGALRFPSRAEWRVLSKTPFHLVPWNGVSLDPTDCAAIRRKLDTMKIDLAFENIPFEDILAFIRDFSGLTLVLDAAVADRVDPARPITFKVRDLVLRNVLQRLAAQFGLDFMITEEQVVLLTDPRRICGRGDD
jgi:hypothetical protein